MVLLRRALGWRIYAELETELARRERIKGTIALISRQRTLNKRLWILNIAPTGARKSILIKLHLI
jgi:hypothetical protein